MATKKPKAPAFKNATFHVEVDLLDRLAVVAEGLSARAGGAHIARNAAARIALERGLLALERELRIKRKK